MINLSEIQQFPSEALTTNFCFDIELMMMAPERVKRIAENLISKIEFNEKLTIEFPILYYDEEPEVVAEVLRLLLQCEKFKINNYTNKHDRLFSLLVNVESPKVIYTFDSESTNNQDIQRIRIQYKITSTQAV